MKVLFIDTVHPILMEKMTEHSWECTDGTNWNRKKVEEQIDSFNGIVIRSKFKVDKAFLDQAQSLKFIARSGSGLENIDLKTCRERDIKCFNSPKATKTQWENISLECYSLYSIN